MAKTKKTTNKAKNKNKGIRPGTGPGSRAVAEAMPRPLVSQLARAEELIDDEEWEEAEAILRDLDRRYPNRAVVLTHLLNLAYDRKDNEGYLDVAERLVRLTPADPELTWGLAGAYMLNRFLASALRTYRRFLERWPGHERAAEARAVARDLEAMLAEALPALGLEGDDALEIAEQHERIQLLSRRSRWAEARELAERVLARKPDFTAVLNNLSQTYAAEGRFDEAIAAAERVLTLDVDNIHALANLVRYHYMNGDAAEARQWAGRLKETPSDHSDHTDVWMKTAEALIYLRDDEGVLAALRGAEKEGDEAGDRDLFTYGGLLYHLAAVAALRLGREAEARRLWRRALDVAPALDIARDNLSDLSKPVGERHAPWPFPLAHWVPQAVIDDLVAQSEASTRRGRDDGNEAIARGQRRFLARHPLMLRLVPELLERGDPAGRELALRLALLSQAPELLPALRDFALGQHGPDDLRTEATEPVQDAGLIPPGLVRMWLQGQWREIQPMHFQVDGEPVERHTGRVRDWENEAIGLLRANQPERAERLLRRALEVAPDAPDLLNNLAAALNQQGRKEEFRALVERIHELDPDYLFGRTNLAIVRILDGRFDEAQALLEPVMTRKHFHVSEFSALMHARLELCMAEGEVDGARAWFDIWTQTDPDPDNPVQKMWEERLSARSLLNDLERLIARRPRQRKWYTPG